ncbi:hypothetical protein OAT67_03460 [Bacteriovoracaceae bacterium]|nr:hypothetical protein [Bacteriovoracaceae bacterium]
MSERPNCLKCKHYYSTYDERSPRGCRFYGFVSASFPTQVVKRETGSECMAYGERVKKTSKKDLDLNDPKLWGEK